MENYNLSDKEYEKAKLSIKENLFGIGRSFVVIGWQLTRIEESGQYRIDGYATLAEFAKAEFNMSPDNVSRYKKVYETFSVPGDRPEIQEKYRDFEFSKLVDMRLLPEEDREHLHPETYREDIRELKEYNKEQENSPAKLLNWAEKPEEILKSTIREYFKNKKKTLNEVYASEAYKTNSIKGMADIVYKDRSTFKTENAFLIFHRYPMPLFAKVGQNEAEDLTWEEFLRTMRELFDQSAAGAHTYEAVFESEGQKMISEENDHVVRADGRMKTEFSEDENEAKTEEKGQKTALYPQREEQNGGNLPRKRDYPHYNSNTMFDSTTGRMVQSFLEEVYTSMKPGNTRRFRSMGAEFAVVYRPGRGEYTFYDQFGSTVCCISRERMETEYENRIKPEEIEPAQEEQIPGQDEIMNHPEYLPESCQKAAEEQENAVEKQQEVVPVKEESPIIELTEISEIWPECLKDIPVPSKIAMDDILEDAEEEMKQFLTIADQGLPERTILKHQLVAGGLRLIKKAAEKYRRESQESEQEPLPFMKNNEQRKEWLRNYKDWGIWYTDEHTGVRYYKYDFKNGARLIAEEYDPDKEKNPWALGSCYMHLVGGPEPERKDGVPKWTWHGRYDKYSNSETELVEFLKTIQKKADEQSFDKDEGAI